MSWLKRAWKRICAFFVRKPVPLKACVVDNLPDKLDSKSVYLVGEAGFIWQVAILCPCGCGEVLHMPVLKDTRPRWRYTLHDDNTLSLYPSVWRKVGCRSHFHLRQSQVVWCVASISTELS